MLCVRCLYFFIFFFAFVNGFPIAFGCYSKFLRADFFFRLVKLGSFVCQFRPRISVILKTNTDSCQFFVPFFSNSFFFVVLYFIAKYTHSHGLLQWDFIESTVIARVQISNMSTTNQRQNEPNQHTKKEE